jgi:hypothetical protein
MCGLKAGAVAPSFVSLQTDTALKYNYLQCEAEKKKLKLKEVPHRLRG